MKRTPLKPGNKPLKRKTPLKPGEKGLKRTGFKKKEGQPYNSLKRSGFKNKSGKKSSRSNPGLSDKWMEKADKLWRELIPLIWNRHCAMCGKPLLQSEGHSHHLIGRAVKLFRHNPLNGIYLCPMCHEHDPKAPHVSPEKFLEWLGAEYPVIFGWLEENQGRIGSGKPDYEAICGQLEKMIAEYS